MATPQGNFIAYQPLKPVEYKIGDLYSKYIDELIKDNKAKEAAAAKVLQQQQKEMGERFDKIKVDPFATISNLQNMGNDMFRKTADYIAEQRMLAENDPKNRYTHLARAEKAARDYSAISTSFGNKDFVDKATAKMNAFVSGESFLNSDDNDKLKMISAGMVDYRLDPESGQIQFALPKNAYATDDDPVQWVSTGEVINLYTNPDEVNLLKNNKANGNNGFMDTTIPSVAKTMQDEWSSNTDGNRTNSWAKFAKGRAVKWFDSTFGDYNANAIDPILNQYSKQYLRKEIETEEDYKKVKEGIIDNIASYVPTEQDTKTRLTAAELQDRRAGTSLKRAQARKLNKDDDRPVITEANGPIYRSVEGKGIVPYHNATVISLGKKGGTLVAFKYKNQNGKGYNVNYAVLGHDEKGRQTYEQLTSKGDARERINRAGLNPRLIEAKILAGKELEKGQLNIYDKSGVIKYDGTYAPNSVKDIEQAIYYNDEGF